LNKILHGNRFIMYQYPVTKFQTKNSMKYRTLLPLAALSALIVSCASQGGGEDYDVSNPYAAPDYAEDSGTPYQPSDVNPAYDTPAVYEDTTPAVPESAAQSMTVHTVVRGDSLWSIGKKYGVSVNSIKQANGLTRDIAVLGAKLQIPAR
jgi:nucleoid-associated protein YgaU